MEIRNWQNISLIIEVLTVIQPKRVLDAGAGIGRWGMLIREFCESRTSPQSWAIEMEGIVENDALLPEHYSQLYNRIHVGEVKKLLPELQHAKWDLVIIDRFLEKLEIDDVEPLLLNALENSAYLLVNITDNAEKTAGAGNDQIRTVPESGLFNVPYLKGSLQNHVILDELDDQGTGFILLSTTDPQNISSLPLIHEPLKRKDRVPPSKELEDLLTPTQKEIIKSTQALVSELDEIKSSRGWRLITRIWGSRIYLGLRAIVKGVRDLFRHSSMKGSGIFIEALDQKNPESQGNEVWLLGAFSKSGEPLRMDTFLLSGGFASKEDPRSGKMIINTETYGKVYLPPLNRAAKVVLLTHPWSGLAKIHTPEKEIIVDLYSPSASSLEVDLLTGEKGSLPEIAKSASKDYSSVALRIDGSPTDLTEQEQAWVEQVKARNPAAIAVIHPNWLGIRSSTKQLFQTVLEVDENLNAHKVQRITVQLLETGCRNFVFSGFPLPYINLVRNLKIMEPSVKNYAIWHGNFMQSDEEYGWKSLLSLFDLMSDGQIYKLGFVKKGMAEAISARLGLKTGFVLNYIDDIPQGPSTPMSDGCHIGVWNIWSGQWRKLPYAMLVAASLVPGVKIHGSHASARVNEFVRLLNIPADFTGDPIPQAEFPGELKKMHLNLYVTLSECAPMVPLESLSVGAPCLLGPNSHYFEDHEYLKQILVVPFPDRSDVIRDHIERALAERDQIIAQYIEYAREYNALAKRSVREFIEEDI